LSSLVTAAGFGFRRELPRWRQLVTPAWLAALLAGAPVVGAPAGEFLLFESSFGGAEAFADRHIPGAGYIDTRQLEGGPLWNKVPDQELKQLLLSLGIRHDTTVVLYGRNNLAAARAAHLLLYAGVHDVRLLDGGFAAWIGAGHPVAQGQGREPRPVGAFGTAFPGRPDYLVGMNQARRLLASPEGTLASIRTWDEFTGKTSGYRYIAARGDISGARWGRAGDGDDVNSMAAYHDSKGRMLPAAQIAQMWQANGIHAARHTAFYCGTGWRASMAFFYAWLMGWERIAVYDGGWCEWSRETGNPVVRRIRTDTPPLTQRQAAAARTSAPSSACRTGSPGMPCIPAGSGSPAVLAFPPLRPWPTGPCCQPASGSSG
jgi:3-mercaptopyruvate sulfurtransferase SseA